MKGKRYSEEQIIYALKAAEGGQKAAHVCRELGVTEVTFYRWKKQYAGMGITELRKLKLLEEENRKAQGNDLSTPLPEYEFPGLQPGDQWCLYVTRWKQALDAGKAPRVRSESIHVSALEFVMLEDLQRHALAGD
jgi:hypothetical protein